MTSVPSILQIVLGLLCPWRSGSHWRFLWDQSCFLGRAPESGVSDIGAKRAIACPVTGISTV